MKTADALDLVLSRGDLTGLVDLLCLEYRVHALGGDDLLAFEIEDERRVLAVEDHDVNLLAEHAVAIDDVSLLALDIASGR